MFTGIVTGIGTVRKARRPAGGLELTIAVALPGPGAGRERGGGWGLPDGRIRHAADVFTVHVVRTTLDRTRFGEYAEGRRVNLERALQVGDRLGGHLVQAHVDGVGTVEPVTQREDARLLDLRVPDEVARVSVPLGSITVDGVSLTVNAKPAPDVIQISLIPFTLQHTTLGERRVGDRVHLEADTIGKYVQALMEEQR